MSNPLAVTESPREEDSTQALVNSSSDDGEAPKIQSGNPHSSKKKSEETRSHQDLTNNWVDPHVPSERDQGEFSEQQQAASLIELDEAAILGGGGDGASTTTTAPSTTKESNNGGTAGEEDDTSSTDTTTAADFETLLFRDDDYRAEMVLPFRVGVFFFELLTTVLFPLSLPVILAVQGKVAAQNKWFFPKLRGPANFMSNVMMYLVTWIPIALVIYLDHPWTVTPVTVCTMFALFRFLIVAGKYAGYSPAQYDAVLQDDQTDISKQLLGALWYEVGPDTVLREMKSAEQVTRLSLKKDVITLKNGTRVTAQKFLFTILEKSFGDRPFDRRHLLLRLLALIFCGYPVWAYLNYYYHHSSPGTVDPLDIVALVIMDVELLMFAPTVFSFMKIGVLHYRRHMVVAEALTDAVLPAYQLPKVEDGYMIQFSPNIVPPVQCEMRLSERAASQPSSSEHPNAGAETELTAILPPETAGGVDLDVEKVAEIKKASSASQAFSDSVYDANLAAWDNMRRVSREFGRGPANRIAFNTFATALVNLFFVLTLLQQFINGTRDWPLFCFIVLSFAVMSGLALLTLTWGYFLNRNEEFVETMLAAEERHLCWIGEQGRKERVRTLRNYIDLRQSTHPVAVMYLPAKPQLISAFVGVVFSGLLIVLQISISSGAKS